MEKKMRYITFALAKGRLATKSLEMFEKIGITCDELKDEKTRKLIFENKELSLQKIVPDLAGIERCVILQKKVA